eukprot:7181174-Prymnesium_polylepis.1
MVYFRFVRTPGLAGQTTAERVRMMQTWHEGKGFYHKCTQSVPINEGNVYEPPPAPTPYSHSGGATSGVGERRRSMIGPGSARRGIIPPKRPDAMRCATTALLASWGGAGGNCAAMLDPGVEPGVAEPSISGGGAGVETAGATVAAVGPVATGVRMMSATAAAAAGRGGEDGEGGWASARRPWAGWSPTWCGSRARAGPGSAAPFRPPGPWARAAARAAAWGRGAAHRRAAAAAPAPARAAPACWERPWRRAR